MNKKQIMEMQLSLIEALGGLCAKESPSSYTT